MGRYVYDALGITVAGFGIFVLFRAVMMLDVGAIIEGVLTALIGVTLFRSGLELIKVGAAVRVSLPQKETGEE